MVQEKHYELVERASEFALADHSRFDRLAYAMRVLAILRPGLKVVLYEAVHGMRIERGRKHGHPGSHLACVGIPKHASRAHIAVGLAQLTQRDRVPYLLDVLLGA
jgi:hypothetical protein